MASFDLRKIRAAGANNAPADPKRVEEMRAVFGGLPPEIEQLWSLCDGFLLGSGVKVCETREIQNRNTVFPLQDNARSYLLIGDDSGGRGLLLPRYAVGSLQICDLAFLDLDDFEDLAPSFTQWVTDGARLRG